MRLSGTTTTVGTGNKRISVCLAVAVVLCFALSMTASSQTVMEWMTLRSGTNNLQVSIADVGPPLQTYVVTNSNDSGPGSLRQAILNANASPGHDAIIFQTNSQNSIANQTVEGIAPIANVSIEAGLASITDQTLVANSSNVITLTSGGLHITESVTINGLGADTLTVSGNNSSKVFWVNRLGNDGSPFVVEINNLTVANGYDSHTSGCGAGINGSGVQLKLNNLVVTQNTSNSTGGGICFIAGTLNITDSVISHNTALAGAGGGIHTGGVDTTLYITNTTISRNSSFVGGGISFGAGTMTVTNSTINNNTAAQSAGGVYVEDSTAYLLNTTVSDNSAALLGGGVGISHYSTAYIVNSTVSNNSALNGGGIQGGGYTSTIAVGNSIVADNSASFNPDVAGNFESSGTNLIGRADYSPGLTNGVNGDQVGTVANPIDPKLGALQNNGGTTATRALLTGSPAINSGNNCVTSTCVSPPLTTDQRGTGFPRQVDGTVDIGAFEAADTDSDGLVDVNDNCPDNPNVDQSDNDADGIGDVCDGDDDNDTVADTTDNCSLTPNTNQANNDGDALGDVCDPDDDNDGIADATDNCSLTANSNQLDTDGDGLGNACDPDDDNDGVQDAGDNCPLVFNPNQADFDQDGIGDTCDPHTGPPRNKDQCKNDGWKRFDFPRKFKNQGDCIQFVNTGK